MPACVQRMRMAMGVFVMQPLTHSAAKKAALIGRVAARRVDGPQVLGRRSCDPERTERSAVDGDARLRSGVWRSVWQRTVTLLVRTTRIL